MTLGHIKWVLIIHERSPKRCNTELLVELLGWSGQKEQSSSGHLESKKGTVPALSTHNTLTGAQWERTTCYSHSVTILLTFMF